MIVVAKKKSKLRSAAIQFLTVGMVLAGVALAYWFLSPTFYQATAKVEIGTADQNGGKTPDGSQNATLLVEYKYLHSDEFVDPALASLHLAERWAKASGSSSPLTPLEVRRIFLTKVRIEAIPHSKVFTFQVTSRDPEETAEIANQLANRFREHRQAQAPIVHGDAGQLAGKFKLQWDTATKKILTAEERLVELAGAISQSLRSNGITVYDARTLDSMQAQRVRLESEFTAARTTQERLRALTAPHLRQVVPTLITNNLLDKTLDLLNHAQNGLRDAQAKLPAEAPEVRAATTNVALLQAGVDQVISGILDARDAEVSALKQTLEELAAKLARAHSSTEAGLTARNPEYQAALDSLDKARYEREQLTNDLATVAVMSVHPTALAAEIVAAATLPRRPSFPNPKVALGLGITGGILTFFGILMLTARSQPATGPNSKKPRFPDRSRGDFPGRN